MVYKLRLCVAILCTSFTSSLAAKDLKLHFDAVPISEFSKAVFADMLESGYVIEEGITQKKISIYTQTMNDKDLPLLINDVLATTGLHAEKRKGIYYIKSLTDQNKPFIYKPKNRPVKYLSDLFRQAFPNLLVNQDRNAALPAENITNDQGANNFASNDNFDYFITQAPQNRHNEISTFLESIDKKNQTVNVIGASYEVSTNRTKASAIQIIGELLGNIGITATGAITGGIATFSTSMLGFNTIISLLDQDQRFRGISKPSLSVDSGESAIFNVGQDVPILANTTINQGNITQGVQYVNSGALLNVTPLVLQDSIRLHVKQEFSNFQRNQLSNIQSPLLNKRLIDTTLTLNDGQIIVLAGLQEVRKGRNAQYVSSLPISSSSENAELETIIILQITKL